MSKSRKVRTSHGPQRALLVSVFLLLSFVVCNAEENKNPPYPDVWGYDFPLPAPNDRNCQIQMAGAPDGDIFMTYVTKRVWTKGKLGAAEVVHHWGGVHFFAKTTRSFTDQEYKEFWNRVQKGEDGWRRVQGTQKITLSDGTSVSVTGLSLGRCHDPMDESIEVQDSSGRTLYKKLVVFIPDKPLTVSADRDCERNWGLKGDKVNARVVNVTVGLILLADDTFLLFDREGNFAVRFEKGLTTRSRLVNTKVFLVDRDAFEQLRADLQKRKFGYNDQSASNGLHEYIVQRQRIGKEGGR